MVEALIVTLREGVEAALIVGIVLAYLTKIRRPDLRRTVYAGLGAAVLGSVTVAVALSRARLNQDVFEGWVMLAAAVFVVSMIVFMMRTARRLRGSIESRVDRLAGHGSQLGLFLFVFLMVLREGVETVLILAAVSLNSTELMNFLGTLIGVGLAVLFGVTFVKGSVRINLQKFFRVTSFILLFVVAQLVISGLHELSENGVLPSSRREMAVIGPIVRNDLFFFVTILALAGLMILFEYRRRTPAAQESSASRAARRKAEWSARRERLWMVAVYGSSFLFIVLVTAQFIYARSTSALSPASPVQVTNGGVTIPVTELADGDLHRFSAVVNGTTVRFWLMRKPDGKIATVFDACEICGPVGFYRTSTGVICKNCSAPVNGQSLGEPGGCNPVPLKATVTADKVTIRETDLDSGAHLFERR